MKKTNLIILVITLLSTTIFAQTQYDVDLKKLDEYYTQMLKDWDVPGATIGIVKDGELIFTGTYGVIEKGGRKKPDGNTLFGIASNTKAFTSTLIAMLVQEGKLNWEDKVKDHLPYFELYDPWVSNNVTVRDLLCHRVGLGTFSGDVIWYKSDFTSQEIVRRAKHIPQAFEFRAGYGYSNVMYITAGELIRTVTGKSWNDNVQERIFEPLGMDRSISSVRHLEDKGNYVTPHARENDKNIPIEWVDWEEIAALGGIISSVNDLAKWMIFNLDHGVVNNDTLLTRESRNLLWTPHNSFTVDHTTENDFNQHFRAYGLGWGLADYHGRLRVSHSGAIDGMITSLTLIPDENLGVVVLTNGMQSPITAATNYALELFLGIEPRDWSTELLDRRKARQQEDTRISSRKEKRVHNTQQSLPLEKYTGTYHCPMHDDIIITKVNDHLRMEFKRAPNLNANLSHWHYDVWKIEWDEKQAWFDFGTIKFNTGNNLEIKGISFDVPNNDIFFHELNPVRVNEE